MQSFEVDIDGRVYRGVWKAGDYDRLSIESDYGSTYAYLDGRDPQALARALLIQLIRRSARAVG